MESCIIKYLAGSATREEIENLSSWRAETEEHERFFREYEAVWRVSNGLEGYLIPSRETVWNKILARIEASRTVRLYSRSILIRIASVAAVMALVIGLSLPFVINPNKVLNSAPIVVKAPKGQKTEVRLPDGSKVWLNSETAISYNTDFNRKERRVVLEGEAFFEVAHDKAKRFVVESGEVQVVVHGTSFNVRAYTDNTSMDVALVEGSVSVHESREENLLTTLRPNQRATVNREDLSCNVEECDAAGESLWKLERLKIDGESILQLVHKLERWYGVEITLEGNVVEEQYWLTIKDESMSQVLDFIDYITPIRYSMNGSKVVIHFE